MRSSSSTALPGPSGVGPLVRATRSQAEVDLLPPYGDPEVSLTGELGTYLAIGGAAGLAYACWQQR